MLISQGGINESFALMNGYLLWRWTAKLVRISFLFWSEPEMANFHFFFLLAGLELGLGWKVWEAHSSWTQNPISLAMLNLDRDVPIIQA